MFYEDFEVGAEYTTEAFSFSAEQIIAFAQTYDPQPFHVDEVAAQASIYGGLIASGWAGVFSRFRRGGAARAFPRRRPRGRWR